MSFAIVGSVLNLMCAICVGCSGQIPAAYGILLLVPAVISLAGAGAASAGSERIGAYLLIGGSIFFVPVGLVAAYGGKKLLDRDQSAPAGS